MCALKNQAKIAKHLLETLQDLKFVSLLYPEEAKQTRIERVNFIVDLYLNMPDRGVSHLLLVYNLKKSINTRLEKIGS